MLLSENVYVKWNSKTKRHYVELGYNFTKMGDSFLVKVNDLTKGSNVKVLVSCDYCGKEYQISWDSYQRLKSKEIIHKDCCGDAECTTKKSQDTLLLKYKTTNIREIPGVNEKITNTNIERYGSGNCFSNDEVKEKLEILIYKNMTSHIVRKILMFKINIKELVLSVMALIIILKPLNLEKV